MGQKKIKMITIQVSNDAGLKAIKALEQKKQITIINEREFDSLILPGSPLSIEAFKELIAEAQNSPTITLQEVKKQWAAKRKRLLKRTQ
jgi:hypothetical protein